MSTGSTRSEIPAAATVVLHVGRQYRASEKAVVEAAFLHHAGDQRAMDQQQPSLHASFVSPAQPTAADRE
jgi:long-subunit fatty acid transport protein